MDISDIEEHPIYVNAAKHLFMNQFQSIHYYHDRPSPSTRRILGFIFSRASLSFSDGVKPNFSSARSERYNPTTLQVSRPTPTPSFDLADKPWYALEIELSARCLREWRLCVLKVVRTSIAT